MRAYSGLPRSNSQSDRFRDTAQTLTSTSLSLGAGTGTSVNESASGSPYRVKTTAFMDLLRSAGLASDAERPQPVDREVRRADGEHQRGHHRDRSRQRGGQRLAHGDPVADRDHVLLDRQDLRAGQ